MNNFKYRLLALILILNLSLCGCTQPHTIHYNDNLDLYIKTMDYHDGFCILQLTDIHWSGGTQIGNNDYGCEKYLTKVINEAVAHTGKIDLIEVTGDTFMLSNSAAVTSFIDFMSTVGIPYAVTWGNHDRQGTYDPDWLSQQFLNAPYCLYTEVDNDDVQERSNYVINLLDSNQSPQWQIINIDSGASYRKGGLDFNLTYGFIRENQFEWMSAEHAKAGKDVPAIVYYHIAQRDNDIAYDAISKGATDYKYKFFKLEGFADSDYSPVTEDKFLANNVKAVFMGHDHSNDWTFTTPSGITYGLGVKTGYELYYGIVNAGYPNAGFDIDDDFLLSGASLVTLINNQGEFSLEHLYLNERDGGDFVKWVKY